MKKVAEDRSGNAGIVYLKAKDAGTMPELSKEIDDKLAVLKTPPRRKPNPHLRRCLLTWWATSVG